VQGLDRAVPPRHQLQDLALRDHLIHGPSRGATYVHVLDEAGLHSPAAGELQEVQHLVVVVPPDDHGVQLDRGEPGLPRGINARDDVGVARAASELLHPFGAKGIEAHRDPPEAGGAERLGLTCEQDAVGGQREIGDRVVARQQCHERGQVVPKERLPAGEPHLAYAEPGEDARHPVDLLEGENRFPRQPDVLRLGHAVAAPEIAAIGDGDPKVAERPAQQIGRVARR
jgi:hypothetical protein